MGMKEADVKDIDLAAEDAGETGYFQPGKPGGMAGGTSEDDSGADETGEAGMYVKFSKPYVFEDDTYEGIDMSGLEKLTADDLTDIEKKFYKLSIASFNPENTAAYAKIVAWKATGLPIEFFNCIPIKDMLKIKSRVVNFFYS